MREISKAGLKQKIQEVAWELFREKGYENTTLSEIIQRAGTSKGGFYYYFSAKEDLLNSLYTILDKEYEKYYRKMDTSAHSLIQLRQLNQYVFYYIEGNLNAEMVAALYQSQLSKQKEEHFLDPNRYYMKLVREILTEGQKKGEIRKDISAVQLAEHVLLLERGILTHWCVSGGRFPLGYQGSEYFRLYTQFMDV
nr:TetR/AcrR family transcriptional regulator [Lachnoclostridium phocaeense]